MFFRLLYLWGCLVVWAEAQVESGCGQEQTAHLTTVVSADTLCSRFSYDAGLINRQE